ncbi:MAG TPA: hypothetical protein VM260_01440, partial [Pirellula sp.]|nr:hypothetical protein [Pirellula sp.]
MNRIRSALRFLLHDAFLRVGFRLSRVKFFEAQIRRWELVNEDFYFVQVGAHNGVTSDPFNQMLVSGQWHALLIEPQLPFVQILRTIYCDRDRIQCCNAAVSLIDGTIKMFMVRSDVEGFPYWCSQLASLNYEVIASHEDRIPGLKNWIMEVDIPSRT